MSMMPLMMMMVVLVGVMYFLQIRPQQKRDRERNELLASLAKGDKVVTTGGICGTIVSVNDSHVVLKVDDNCKVEFIRQAVAYKVTARATQT
ncbi:MAG: preprotein translocase subunit YajC [Candidatus Competibacteraceae bacterium]|nr:preprotein translocase subunit YajC [Candidatus Competibacteraceae bacterium]